MAKKKSETKNPDASEELNGSLNRRNFTEEEIEKMDIEDEEIQDLRKLYEEETDKYTVWRGAITEGFKKWLKGEKIYDRDKERISLYVTADVKTKWTEFKKNHEYSTISALIRESVDYFIERKSDLLIGGLNKMDDNGTKIKSLY